jgi:hypothetical protein
MFTAKNSKKCTNHYEAQGKGRKTIKARELWEKILESQIETGTPYMLYKDAANRKSNQKNLGTIRSSNLCTEIMEYTAKDEIAVCNLASISLPMFIENGIQPPIALRCHQTRDQKPEQSNRSQLLSGAGSRKFEHASPSGWIGRTGIGRCVHFIENAVYKR